MGHARALLALSESQQSDAGRIIAAKQLTVRETESLVRRLLEPAPEAQPKVKDPDVAALEQRLSERFAAPVSISYSKKGKGELVIGYSNLNELDGILQVLQQGDQEIFVDPALAERAKLPLDRMLNFSAQLKR